MQIRREWGKIYIEHVVNTSTTLFPSVSLVESNIHVDKIEGVVENKDIH